MISKKMMASSVIATLAIAAVGTTAVTASAVEKYAVKKGKLINVKTGKTVKGYVVYKGKLYKNGKKNKGYALVGKGSSLKLYYNTSLKKGYKTASNAKYLFKDGKLVKGFKQASNHKRLYKNGVLTTGYKVYQAKDETLYLYYKGQLKQGLKTASYNGEKVLFKDGLIAIGDAIFKQQLYTDGKLNTAFKEVDNVFYYNSVLANGEIDGLTYVNGQLTTPPEEVAYEKAKAAFIESEQQVNALTKDYEALVAIEQQLNGEVAPKAVAQTLDVEQSDVAQFLQTLKSKDFTKLSADEKAQIANQVKQHKEATTAKLQQAVTTYLAAIEKVTEVSQVLVAKDPSKKAVVQATITQVKEAVTALKEATKIVQDLKIESSKLEAVLKQVETIVTPPKEQLVEKPAEQTSPSVTPPNVSDVVPSNPIIVEKPTEETQKPVEEKPVVKEPTENIVETIPDNDAINDINKPLPEIIELLSFDLKAELISEGDVITIDGEQYVVNENGRSLEGPTKYVDKAIAQELLDAYNASKTLVADQTASSETLAQSKGKLNRTIGFLKEKATNKQLTELSNVKWTFYQAVVITDETDTIALRTVIATSLAKNLPEGVTVKVEKVMYNPTQNKYLANYTLTKGDAVLKSYSNLEITIKSEKDMNTEIEALKSEVAETQQKYHATKDEDGNITAIDFDGQHYEVVTSPKEISGGKYITKDAAIRVDNVITQFQVDSDQLKEWKDAVTNLRYTVENELDKGWTSVEREEIKNIPEIDELYVVHESHDDAEEDYQELLALVVTEIRSLLPEDATLEIQERENNGSYIVNGIELTYTITKGDVSYTNKRLFKAISSAQEAIKREDALELLAKIENKFTVPTLEDPQLYLNEKPYQIVANINDAKDLGRYVSEEAAAKLIQQYDDIISSTETVRAETLEKMIRQLSNILDDLELYSTRTVYEQEQ